MQQLSEYVVDGVKHVGTPRNELMAIVEVETDLVGTFSLGEQAVSAPYPEPGVPRGPFTAKVLVYESFVPAIQSQVRTDKHKSAFESALAEGKATETVDEARKTAKAKLARAKPGTSGFAQAEQELADVEHLEFREALRLLRSKPGCRDGLPPLLSARVIKANVPPPPTMQTVMQNGNADLAAMLVKLLEERSGKKNAPKPE